MKQVIENAFSRTRERGEMVLIAYLMGGFPSMELMRQHMLALTRAGVDIIEVGVPFSDPIADGTSIQYASQRALLNGTTLQRLFQVIGETPLPGTPLVLMSYCNPLLAYGKQRALTDMSGAGFSGIIIPDLPVEESASWLELAKNTGIAPILLAAPTSSNKRISVIAERSEGFVYCVSTTGTTGFRDELDPSLFAFIKRVRNCTEKPVVVGFGIAKPEQISMLSGHIDGVVVGSRIIEAIRHEEDVEAVLLELKESTRIGKKEFRSA